MGISSLTSKWVLAFAGNIFWNGGKGNTVLGTAENDQVVADVIGQASFSNSFEVDPLLFDDISADGTINPIPSSSSPAASGAATIDTALVGLTQTTYRGAFDPTAPNWMYGWTKLGELGSCIASMPQPHFHLSTSSGSTRLNWYIDPRSNEFPAVTNF